MRGAKSQLIPLAGLAIPPEVRWFDGRFIDRDHAAWEEAIHSEIGMVQGHVICHFSLWGDPITLPPEDPLDAVRVYVSPPRVAEKAQRSLAIRRRIVKRLHWSANMDPVALRIVGQYEEDGMPDLLPVRDGRVMHLEQARRWWIGMLSQRRR